MLTVIIKSHFFTATLQLSQAVEGTQNFIQPVEVSQNFIQAVENFV